MGAASDNVTTTETCHRATDSVHMLGKLLGADAASVICAPEANLDLAVV